MAGHFSYKGSQEFYIGVKDDRFGLCNGMWGVYMFDLSKADKHSQQNRIFRYSGRQSAMSRTQHSTLGNPFCALSRTQNLPQVLC